MTEHDRNEQVRQAAEALRRFIKSRWEEPDEALFMTRKPVKTRMGTNSGTRPVAGRAVSDGRIAAGVERAPVAAQPTRPAWTPPQRPAPVSRPVAAPSVGPTVGSTAMKHASKPGRHESGIINPEGSAKGKALLALWNEIKGCMRCPLGSTRHKFVFGMGTADTHVVFIGEAPGEQEDNMGLPFVGAAGTMLDNILAEVGMHRDRHFICNVLKCRPPGNRNPSPDEMEECEPHLNRQMKILAPKYVVALGKFAAQSVLRSTLGIGQLRGRWHIMGDFEVLPTYHPAAACRTGSFRQVLKDDLVLLKKRLDDDAKKPSPDRTEGPGSGTAAAAT